MAGDKRSSKGKQVAHEYQSKKKGGSSSAPHKFSVPNSDIWFSSKDELTHYKSFYANRAIASPRDLPEDYPQKKQFANLERHLRESRLWDFVTRKHYHFNPYYIRAFYTTLHRDGDVLSASVNGRRFQVTLEQFGQIVGLPDQGHDIVTYGGDHFLTLHETQLLSDLGFTERSIASSFFSGSSNPAKSLKEDTQNKDSNKGSAISLSDFLDRKLHNNPQKTVKGKSNPFSSPLDHRNDGGGRNEYQIRDKRGEEERNFGLDTLVFEQFKTDAVENGEGTVNECDNGRKESFITSFGVGSSHVGEAGTSIANDKQKQEARKIRSSVEGMHIEFPNANFCGLKKL
ncbi:hypothetical protein Tsubulata_015647 [Turnera subulata]|uniref:Uncharacterized protein n=1 Tax=Turnera subulata TaxID=218843 RepID=A0A9Q0J1F2_9ROSI|nr:hypothetical protein Tsubulata_015647 [Turnera subulata]